MFSTKIHCRIEMMKMLKILATVLATTWLCAPAASAQITADTVDDLKLKWDFSAGLVTASPVLANGLLYVASWDGFIYALDPDDGSTVWSHDTGSGGLGITGSQTTPLVTPAGNVCVGTTLAEVTCLDGASGAVVWGPKSIGTPQLDNIWSGLATANGLLYVSVASILDQPCTNGRLLALDLDTGAGVWSLQTVPDNVCMTDTATECSTNADCPDAGRCVAGRGAGVTATVSFDPTDAFLYMNTVGCFTYPSIGDSDSFFKVDALTGAVVWKTRVNAPEQFGECVDDISIGCGRDADCPSGTCDLPQCADHPGILCSVAGDCPSGDCQTLQVKAYNDFGFLNGPIPVDIDDGGGGTKTVVISGSKNGTLYALDEATGAIAWSNAVQPTPTPPGFAGFGLFNGPLSIADGRVYAALYQLIPRRVCANDNSVGCSSDSDCGAGTCLADVDHLMAFDADDGSIVWSDDIGPTWSATSVSNGIVFAGSDPGGAPNGLAELLAYDAVTGARLAAYQLPNQSVTRAVVDGDSLYVGYGVLSFPGGVHALELRCPGQPQSGCLTGQKSTLLVKKAGGDKDLLKWKLVKGQAFDQADLGLPQSSTNYSLCMYDETGNLASRQALITVPSSALWQDKSPKGFKYSDKVASADGVNGVQLKPGAEGKGKVQLKAKGANLPTPPPVAADKYFNVDSKLTVQLIADGDVSTCWTADFTSAKKNDGSQFKASAP